MQKQGIYTIQENAPLTRTVYRMVLAGEIPDAKTQVGILQLYAKRMER